MRNFCLKQAQVVKCTNAGLRFNARVFVSSVKQIFYASILKLLTKYILTTNEHILYFVADTFLLTDQVKKRIYHVKI